jgi:DNA-directed RNA polymerase specialized sigma24 family protein
VRSALTLVTAATDAATASGDDLITQPFAATRGRIGFTSRATLDESPQMLMYMRHVIGLSPREISHRMAHTEGSIHGLHHRGRRALQRQLERLDSAPLTLETGHLAAA